MPGISEIADQNDTVQHGQCMAELLGLARGLMADQELRDDEIQVLDEWLDRHSSLASSYPVKVLQGRVKDVLDDGLITESEREHLVDTLRLLIDGRLNEMAEQVKIKEFWFDEAGLIEFNRTRFCLAGNFIYGPREACERAIVQKGGLVCPMISADSQFLVVGGLGVDEWRMGGLGRKIETAIELKTQGANLKIIAEDAFVEQLV